MTSSLVTDRVSREGKEIRPSVRLFPLCLLNRLTFELGVFVRVWVMTIASLQLKVQTKVWVIVITTIILSRSNENCDWHVFTISILVV